MDRYAEIPVDRKKDTADRKKDTMDREKENEQSLRIRDIYESVFSDIEAELPRIREDMEESIRFASERFSEVAEEELEMVEGATVSLCFAGLCYPPTTSSSGTIVIPAQSTLPHSSDYGFHFSYKTPMAGTSFVRFVFANEDNDDDNASITFKLVYDPTSIVSTAMATKMRAYPNPASDNVTIEYAYTGNSDNVKLVVKNMLGTTLLTKKLDANGNKVKVDVSEYNAGIYFYSIEADGRPLITKKLLVK